MARLIWDAPGTHLYESGIDRGVLYPQDSAGVAWSGLIAVREAPSDSENVVRYIDGVRYNTQQGAGTFAASIEAFTYPDEFEEYSTLRSNDGRLQRKTFGLSYRTRIGNDSTGTDYGYKIHLVYNARAIPAQRDRTSMDTSQVSPVTLAWDISTTPIHIAGAKPSAHLIIDTTIAHPAAVEALENLLYGSETDISVLPQPNEVLQVFEDHAIVRITDNGDGTWTAEGPDNLVKMLNPSTFQIDIPTAVYLDAKTYRVHSY